MGQLKSRAMWGEMVNINKVPTTHRTIQRCSQGLFLKESLKKTQGFLMQSLLDGKKTDRGLVFRDGFCESFSRDSQSKVLSWVDRVGNGS